MRLLRGACVLSVVVAVPATAWAQTPAGPEFQINSYTTGTQRGGPVSMAADGSFVAVWPSLNQDGGGYGVFGQRFDASGAPVGPEFRVNSFTTGNQRVSSVSSAPDGRFVVVWTSTAQDGNSGGVFGQRFDAAGNPAGPEFRVNTYITGNQFGPSVSVAANGGFVVVWTSDGQDGHLYGVFGQRYDASGAAQGLEFRVNEVTTSAQGPGSVATGADGRFVVTWQGQDGSYGGAFGRRYDAAGAALGSEFAINTYTTGRQSNVTVGSAPDGRFTVTWTGPDGSLYGGVARRYDAAGVAQGPEFPVNSVTNGYQSGFRGSVTAEGGFVVAWVSFDGQGDGVFARRFDGAGNPEGVEVLVNVFTTSFQRGPSVAAAPDGRFVVAWTTELQEAPTGYGVFGRRFTSSDLIFADNFESGTLSAWSANVADGGDLSVTGGAALKSTTMGLQGEVDDTVGLYVQDNNPIDEGRYRARFYFETNGFDPGEAQNHRRTRLLLVFEENPTRRVAAIVLRRIGGAYAILGRARLDDDSQYDTGFFPISDGEHYVELDWQRSSGPDANDGAFELWIDGMSVHAATGLDNSISGVDFVRMGTLSVKTGAAGTLHFDEFVSRRQTYSGP